MNNLFIACGLPGSGKSTWFSESSVINIEKAEPCPRTVLSVNDFRKVLTGQKYYTASDDIVVGMVKIAAKSLLLNQNITVAIDDLNLTKKDRLEWIKISRECNCDIHCIWFKTPMKECFSRLKTREIIFPEEKLLQMELDFEKPLKEEGFKSIFEI